MRQVRMLCVVIASVFTPALVAEFQVNTQATYDQTDAAIAIYADGDFLTVWSSYHQDGDSGGIFARRFDPNCREVGGEFQINTETIGNQTEPAIAMHEAGSFVVAWHSPGTGEQDIYARRFNASCVPVGYEIRLNSFTANDQKYPAAAIARSAKFVAAWQSDGQDGSGYGIFATTDARVCPTDLFDDGFVDFLDYSVFAAEWLAERDSHAADLVEDGLVNPRDLAEFCQDWLTPCHRCSLVH